MNLFIQNNEDSSNSLFINSNVRMTDMALVDAVAKELVDNYGYTDSYCGADGSEGEYYLLLISHHTTQKEMKADYAQAKADVKAAIELAQIVAEEEANQGKDYFVFTMVDSDGSFIAEFSDFDKEAVQYERNGTRGDKKKIHTVAYSAKCVENLILELNGIAINPPKAAPVQIVIMPVGKALIDSLTIEDAKRWEATSEKFIFCIDFADISADCDSVVNAMEERFEGLLNGSYDVIN